MSTTMSPVESLVRAPAGYTQQLFMTTGDGVDSYARNSHPQGDYMSRLLPKFFDVIDRMSLPQEGIITVADLGCSSGPNTIRNVEATIARMKTRFRRNDEPEFQAYFQDLCGTDFNTLFRILDQDQKKSGISADGIVQAVQYFAAGVPGSFYGRLFPRASLHFVMSSFALHWISKIPEAVLDKKSPAYNGGHTHLHHSSIATVNAYAEEADRDLRSFLAARAVELARGGSMLLVFGIRETYYPYNVGPTIELQEKIWNDLVSEGALDAELRDSHNGFVYFRTLYEIDKVLSNFSPVFKIEKREITPSPLSSSFSLNPAPPMEMARRHTSVMKGAGGSLLETHFGKQATNLFMQRYEQELFEGFSNNTLVEDLANTRNQIVLVLSRK